MDVVYHPTMGVFCHSEIFLHGIRTEDCRLQADNNVTEVEATGECGFQIEDDRF